MKILAPITLTDTDIVYSNLRNFYPIWDINTSYGISTDLNQVLVVDDFPSIDLDGNTWYNVYKSIKIPNQGRTPVFNPDYWQFVGIEFLQHGILNWNSGTIYNTLGQIVVYEDYYYTNNNISGNLNKIPSNNPTHWTKGSLVNSKRFIATSITSGSYGFENITLKLKQSTVEKNVPQLVVPGIQYASNISLSIDASENSYLANPEYEYLDKNIHIKNIITPNSSSDPTETVSKAFDNKINTKWYAFSISNKITAIIELTQKIAIQKFQLVTANDMYERDPVTILISGSNNNINWTQLYLDALNLPNSRFTSGNLVDINNYTGYTYYKLELIQAKDSGNSIQIGNINLYYNKNDITGSVYKNKDIWKYVDITNNSVYSSNTSIQKNYILVNPNQIISAYSVPASTYPPEAPIMAFDNDTITKWNESWPQNYNIEFIELIVRLSTSIAIQKVQFVTANDHPERDPVTFYLYGSSDNINWTYISANTVDLPLERETASSIYNVNNLTDYVYYKFRFTSLRGDNLGILYDSIQLSELKLFYNQYDVTGSTERNQYSFPLPLGPCAFNRTQSKLVVAEDSWPSSIYYATGELYNLSNWSKATLPKELRVNRVYSKVINETTGESIYFAVGGDLAQYTGTVLYSYNAKDWYASGIGPFQSDTHTAPIADITWIGGSLNRFMFIDYFGRLYISNPVNNALNPNAPPSPAWFGLYYQIPSTQFSFEAGKFFWSETTQTLCVSGRGPTGKPAIAHLTNLIFNVLLNNNLAVLSIYVDTTQPNYLDTVTVAYYNNNWLALGSERAYFGTQTGANITWTDISPIFYNNTLETYYGLFGDIGYNAVNGWIVSGAARAQNNPSFNGKILSWKGPGNAAEVLLSDTQYTPYPFGDLAYSTKRDATIVSPIGGGLAVKSPLYYREKDITTDNATAIFNDIPLTSTLNKYTELVYTIQITGNSTVGLSGALFGDIITLGDTQYGVQLGITDYSKKEVDEFGNAIILERPFTDRISLNILVPVENLKKVQKILTNVRAKPCLWIGSETSKYQNLIVYGYYRNFSIELSNPRLATVNLELESLI